MPRVRKFFQRLLSPNPTKTPPSTSLSPSQIDQECSPLSSSLVLSSANASISDQITPDSKSERHGILKKSTPQTSDNVHRKPTRKKTVNDRHPIVVRHIENILDAASILADATNVPGLKAAVGGVQQILKIAKDIDDNRDKCDNLIQTAAELVLDISTIGKRLFPVDGLDDSVAIKAEGESPGDQLKQYIIDFMNSVTEVHKMMVTVIRQDLHNGIFHEIWSQGRIADELARHTDSLNTAHERFKTRMILITAVTVHTAASLWETSLLPYAPARFDANNTASECLEGTRATLLTELIERLAGSKYPSSQFLWIRGSPGTGKSTIAKTVAVRLHASGLLGASFFFSREDASRRSIDLVFSTIASQLADFSPAFSVALADIVRKDMKILNASPEKHLQELIVNPFAKILPQKRPFVIILDALDECGADKGTSLLQCLALYAHSLPKNLHFLLTSRPEYTLGTGFAQNPLHSLTYTVKLESLDRALDSTSTDIRQYLAHNLQDIQSSWRAGWQATDEDIDSLVDLSAGLFQFAATAVGFIKLYTGGGLAPSESLNMILAIHDVVMLPHGGERPHAFADLHLLDKLYLTILEQSFPKDLPFPVKNHIIPRYKFVVGAILNLREPLPGAVLADLLGMSLSDIESALRPLHSVITVPDDTNETIRISHLSFREFITNSVRETRPDLLIEPSHHHDRLFERCISIMNTSLHRNMCALSTQDLFRFNKDITDLDVRISTHIPRYLQYACHHWAWHMSSKPISNNAFDTWCRKNMMFWLEVLSFCDQLELADPLLWYARSHLSDDESSLEFHRSDEKLTSNLTVRLLDECRLFLSKFHGCIQRSTGHIYISALPFIPLGALREQYQQFTEDFVRVISGKFKDWGSLTSEMAGADSITFSPDGRRIVTGDSDPYPHPWPRGLSRIRIWSAETGETLSSLESLATTGAIDVAAMSADNDLVAVCRSSAPDAVHIWSIAENKMLATCYGHAQITSVAFSPNSHRVVSGSEDSTIQLWVAKTGELISTFGGHHSARVISVTFSPNGDSIGSEAEDGLVQVRSIETGDILLTYLHTESLSEWGRLPLEFTSDGLHLVFRSQYSAKVHVQPISETTPSPDINPSLYIHDPRRPGWVCRLQHTEVIPVCFVDVMNLATAWATRGALLCIVTRRPELDCQEMTLVDLSKGFDVLDQAK